MSAPTIQPGTRCECRGGGSQHMHHYHDGRTTPNCQRDAVRTVAIDGVTAAQIVPLCAPCADYHEKARAAK